MSQYLEGGITKHTIGVTWGLRELHLIAYTSPAFVRQNLPDHTYEVIPRNFQLKRGRKRTSSDDSFGETFQFDEHFLKKGPCNTSNEGFFAFKTETFDTESLPYRPVNFSSLPASVSLEDQPYAWNTSNDGFMAVETETFVSESLPYRPVNSSSLPADTPLDQLLVPFWTSIWDSNQSSNSAENLAAFKNSGSADTLLFQKSQDSFTL